MSNTNFIKLLKKYTNIDKDFIDTFFKKFRVNNELSFHLKDIDVANYLGITLRTLRERLSNDYAKNNNYIKNADFVKCKNRKNI